MTDSSSLTDPAALIEKRMRERRFYEARFLLNRLGRDLGPEKRKALLDEITRALGRGERLMARVEELEGQDRVNLALEKLAELETVVRDHPGLAETRERLRIVLRLGRVTGTGWQAVPEQQENAPAPNRKTGKTGVAENGRPVLSGQRLPGRIRILILAGLPLAVLAAVLMVLALRAPSPEPGEQPSGGQAYRQEHSAPGTETGVRRQPLSVPPADQGGVVVPEGAASSVSMDLPVKPDAGAASGPIPSLTPIPEIGNGTMQDDGQVAAPKATAKTDEQRGAQESAASVVDTGPAAIAGGGESKEEVPETDMVRAEGDVRPSQEEDGEKLATTGEAAKETPPDPSPALPPEGGSGQEVGAGGLPESSPAGEEAGSLPADGGEIQAGDRAVEYHQSEEPVLEREARDESRDSEEDSREGGAGTRDGLYTVRPGDTLESIAQKVYGDRYTWSRLVEANRDRLGDSLILSVGMELRVPPPGEEKENPLNSDGTYTVRSGDSLGSIARRVYGSSRRWQELYRLNRDQLDSPADLQVGMILRVHEQESRVDSDPVGE